MNTRYCPACKKNTICEFCAGCKTCGECSCDAPDLRHMDKYRVKELEEQTAYIAQLQAALHESNYLFESMSNLPNDGFGWIQGRVDARIIRNRALLAQGKQS